MGVQLKFNFGYEWKTIILYVQGKLWSCFNVWWLQSLKLILSLSIVSKRKCWFIYHVTFDVISRWFCTFNNYAGVTLLARYSLQPLDLGCSMCWHCLIFMKCFYHGSILSLFYSDLMSNFWQSLLKIALHCISFTALTIDSPSKIATGIDGAFMADVTIEPLLTHFFVFSLF